MRKKSHISLARYVVNALDDEELRKHKFAFYVGSILPDIKPSFIYRRHEMDGTFADLKRHIERLSEGRKSDKEDRAQILYGSGADQPLSGGLFYIFHITVIIRVHSRSTVPTRKS